MSHKVINGIITRTKGESFAIDQQVPWTYIIYVACDKIKCWLYAKLRLRTSMCAFVHPTAIIRSRRHLNFGKNLSIARGCHIDALAKNGIKLGDNVSFGPYTFMQATGSLRCIGKGIVIGNNVGLGTHGYYGGAGGLEIGDDTIIGNYVSFHPENHNYGDLDFPIRMQGTNHKGIKVGTDCWIGAKATILDGSNIGNGCVVAAGAVVRGHFPDNSIIGGVPAKILKMRK